MAVAPNTAGVKSALFTPGDRPDRLRRALDGPADAVIADLEDGVAPTAKAGARRAVAGAFAASPGPRRMLRVNAAAEHLGPDIQLAIELGVDAVVLPKAEPGMLDNLPPDCPPIVAIIETAEGLRRCFDVAIRPTVQRLMLGSVDLAAELGLEPEQDSRALLHARSVLVTDSAAARIEPPIDGVWTRLEDLDGLRREALSVRALGFRGKACLHPRQLAVVDEVFTPGTEDVESARRIVSAYADAHSAGTGAIAIDGQMVDVAVVRRAQGILDQLETRR